MNANQFTTENVAFESTADFLRDLSDIELVLIGGGDLIHNGN
jgi:hypothetical protein